MADDIPFKKTMEFEYGVPRELAPGVVRVVANNPSPFTFKGTNTYIIGTSNPVLIDPGPDDDAHFDATIAALGGRPLSHILVTHTHRDHIDGLARLKTATGAQTCGFGRTALEPGVQRRSASGSEFVDQDFVPDVPLAHESKLTTKDGLVLTAVHTPGHAPDHLCFGLGDTGLLFSGDHVMGWNTSVVAPPEGNMNAYMGSLERLLQRKDQIYLPGHGGRIEQPARVVRAFIVHRNMREQAILDSIRAAPKTIPGIVTEVYRGLDSRLVNAAALSVQAHVERLLERRLVTCQGPLTRESVLSTA
jgi:glyoxylase-like metal-dependent hydrolase (beta-lactamase superfamily II)